MNKRLLYGLLTVVLGLNLFFGSQIYLSRAATSGKDDAYPNLELFTRVMETIRQHYVDPDKITYQDLVHAAIRGMVGTLDPHSEFMEPQRFVTMKDDTEGHFGGVGILVGVRTNASGIGTYLMVIEPMEETPALKAGILAGDRITRINGKSTDRTTIDDAVKKLRGKPGTDVEITVLRPTTGKEWEVKLTRAAIRVDTVKDINGRREFPVGENGIGYVRLRQFGEPTANEIEEALKKLEAQGLKALILDVRDNPGGLLDQAVKVSEKFLPRNQLVVSTEGRSPGEKVEYRASGRTRHPDVPMVVLVNGFSASASEIVAGCLQDLKRAVVLGEQTFGKGSVQSILPMPGDTALRLTTAKYYTPSHKVIHEKGITPDILVPMSAEEEELLAIKRAPGGPEGLPDARRDAVRNARDTQLDRAMDLLRGITLYASPASPSSAPAKAAKKTADRKSN
jgi:carboxyl-terminal processing protease